MFSTTGRVGKLIAAASTLALASVGIVGVNAAFAANIDSSQNGQGKILVHKFAQALDDEGNPILGEEGTGNPVDSPVPGAGDPLEGVTFTLQEVTYKGDSLALTTSEGWKQVDDIKAITPSATAALPTDFDLTTPGTTQITDANGLATFANLDFGMYLVTETASGDNLIETPAAPFWVTVPFPNSDNADRPWLYEVNVYPKNQMSSVQVTKTVDDEAVFVGDDVTWTIETTVPKLGLPYNSFVISDPLSADLDFVSWGKIMVGSQELTKGTDYTISADNKTITFGKTGLKALDDATAAGSAKVTVDLVSTVNKVTTSGKNVNTVSVTVNGTEVTDEANTNVGILAIKKVDESDTTKTLPGAVFELYADAPNGTDPTGMPIATSEPTGTTGEISWDVHVGIVDTVERTFWVREITAPTGYVLPANPWKEITVKAGTENKVVIPIDNFKAEGPDLPLTGAQGTLLFTVAGIGLMVVAGGALMVRRARRNHS